MRVKKKSVVIGVMIAAAVAVIIVYMGAMTFSLRHQVTHYLQEKQVDVYSEVDSINAFPYFWGWRVAVRYYDEPDVAYYFAYKDKEIVFISVVGKPKDGQSYKYLFDFQANVATMDTPLPVAYSYFANASEGVILGIGDQAMGTYALQVYKTEDSGKTWRLQTENAGDFIAVSVDAAYLFISGEVGFISNPARGGREAKLLMTANGGKTFAEIRFVDDAGISPENGKELIRKDEVYDYYELPVYANEVLTVIVSQGSDGDFNGGKTVLAYQSRDMGATWEFIAEYERY